MKKYTALLILTSLLCSLAACGGTAPETDTPGGDTAADTTPAETTDPRYAVKEELPDKTYDGYKVRVLIRNSTSPD